MVRRRAEVGLATRLAVATAAVIALIAGAMPAPGAPGAALAAGEVRAASTTGELVELLPLQTANRRIVDTSGRDVLLRGANVNSLGEYWQGVPTVPATLPVTDADWDRMAAHGFSVVRLLLTWSRVEPVRDSIDHAYLDEVEAAVDAAAERGIYTVIDMHQDAYSAFISTTDPASCPPGTHPAKGWDGAPGWATLTDGLSTCRTNHDRNSSPAVNRAWNNFYDNVDGIRDEFAEMWGVVAARFAGRPDVAGFDILNEPENPRPAAELQPLYDQFVADVVTAIRGAQAGAPFDHIVFIEPALPAGDVSRGLVIPSPDALADSSNIAASVHNYAESIGIDGIEVTIEAMNELIDTMTASLGVPNWGGEYGFWDTEPDTLAKARRYAADEDRLAWGGAWWQWRQSCGDPHAVQWSNGQLVAPSGTSTHLNLLGCPDNVDLGPNEAFLTVLGRGYPRAAPGRIVELRSDPDTGDLLVRASVDRAGGTLVVWTPTADGASHPVSTFGLTQVTEHPVPGGRIITAQVIEAGDYALAVGTPLDLTPAAPLPAAVVTATPIFTG